MWSSNLWPFYYHLPNQFQRWIYAAFISYLSNLTLTWELNNVWAFFLRWYDVDHSYYILSDSENSYKTRKWIAEVIFFHCHIKWFMQKGMMTLQWQIFKISHPGPHPKMLPSFWPFSRSQAACFYKGTL